MLEENHAHIVYALDVNAMRECAAVIEGEHDFKGFEASGSVIKNTVRTVYKIDIVATVRAERDGKLSDGELEIYVTGNGFLYNMVRIIAGTLVYVGAGKMTREDVEKVLESGDRTLAGKTLPPEGLTLVSVEYGD